MIQAVLLFCCVLLSTSPRNAQEGALTFQLSFIETKHPLLSNQIPLPDPKTHQDLLCMVPTLASLPEYLSNLALEVTLEEVGYLTEAHILQLQLAKMRGKDTTETLICESKKHNEEEANSILDMCGLRFITVLVELLLCCFLLHAVDAISYGNKTKFLVHLPSSLGSWPPSSDPLSCETLLPKSLPGFTHMAPLPKFLIGLSLMIALEKAGCQADVQVLKLQLYRQGGINATEMLIRHLQELEKGRSSGRGVSADALSSALQQWAEEQTSPKRARRSLSIKDCEHEKEQSVHNIVQLLPGVGTFYNLGTALYYAVQNCSDKAKERGRDGVIDLGYDLLTAMAGSSGGPWGILISTSLKPVVKSGIHRVIQYYNEREVKTPPPETSKEVLGSTIAMGDLEETATVTPLVSEVVSSPPYWWWTLFKGYNSDPGFGNPAI